MQAQNPKPNNQGRISKSQRAAYFQNMDNLFSNLANEDKVKMEYVRGFLKKLPLPDIEDEDTITIGPMDYRLFRYMLFWLVMEYDTASDNSKVK